MSGNFRKIFGVAGISAVLALSGCGKGGETNATSAAGGDAAPQQVVNLNLASSFPGSLQLLGDTPVQWTKTVSELSGGTLNIKFFEPGALVPGLEAIPAASKGSVDMAWASSGYFAGTDSTFSFFTAVPFGPNPTEFLAWMYYGNGQKLADELYAKHNIKHIPCHMIPPEASGWFKKEIKTVNDLKGLKMRFFGLGAKVMDKLGVATQLLAGGEIFQALQLGTIDATEFSMPSSDQSFGFYQVAKHYYFPGWHQPASFNGIMINMDVWNKLSAQHKKILEVSCGDNIRDGLARGEASQPPALKAMQDKGVTIHRWWPEILAAYEKAWNEVVKEESDANPNFKKVYDDYTEFRKNFKVWRDNGYLN